MTVDAINKAGGVKVGGNVYKLELKMYEDQSDPNLSVRLFTRLVTSDKVDFLLGPYSSGITIPASAVSEKYEIPMVQGGEASGQIFSRGYKYIFGTLPKAEFYFQSAIELATKMSPRVQTAALLYSNEAFDRSVGEGSRQWLKDHNIEKVYDEEYQPATQDFTSILAVIKSKNPDLILLAGHVENSLNFIRQAQDVSPKMWVFTVGPPPPTSGRRWGRPPSTRTASPPGWPTWTWAVRSSSRPGSSTSSSVPGSATRRTTTWRRGRPTSSCSSYAIEKANSLDPKKVRDALAILDVETLHGRVKFEPTGQIAMGQVVIQIQEGKVVPVYAAGKLAGKPGYPMPKWGQRK